MAHGGMQHAAAWPTTVAGPLHATVGGTAWPTTVAGPLHATVGGTAYPTTISLLSWPTILSAETAVGHDDWMSKVQNFQIVVYFCKMIFKKYIKKSCLGCTSPSGQL
jgi:hypothetical protein